MIVQNYWIILSARYANCLYPRASDKKNIGITSTSLTNGLPSCTETKQNEVKLTRKEMNQNETYWKETKRKLQNKKWNKIEQNEIYITIIIWNILDEISKNLFQTCACVSMDDTSK